MGEGCLALPPLEYEIGLVCLLPVGLATAGLVIMVACGIVFALIKTGIYLFIQVLR
jgi:hypothetical protein